MDHGMGMVGTILLLHNSYVVWFGWGPMEETESNDHEGSDGHEGVNGSRIWDPSFSYFLLNKKHGWIVNAMCSSCKKLAGAGRTDRRIPTMVTLLLAALCILLWKEELHGVEVVCGYWRGGFSPFEVVVPFHDKLIFPTWGIVTFFIGCHPTKHPVTSTCAYHLTSLHFKNFWRFNTFYCEHTFSLFHFGKSFLHNLARSFFTNWG